ncbi:hypothetical protein E2562_008839 [Oryza meyeriana var. granulata]|uniref:Uncharacterized protein n=1 Tax=Oryza meyeriana var. granulata TaxID=110450 RepID=A0A6G1D033_9ORYZ|nr:hypothetical protein E2562_008839 [Oryza meyeriana var. granulata]
MAKISEAMEMMLLSFVGQSVQAEWELSAQAESLITSVVFVGYNARFWLEVAASILIIAIICSTIVLSTDARVTKILMHEGQNS